MIKRTAILVFALATALAAAAKGIDGVEWGVTASVRYNGLAAEGASDTFSLTPRIGYGAGIHAGLIFGEFAVQPELNYFYSTARAAKSFDKGKTASTVKAHDVEIPILFSVRSLPVVRFNAGPLFTLMSSARYIDDKGEQAEFGGLRPTFGYAAGISLSPVRHLIIDLRFTGYFGRTVNEYNPRQLQSGFDTFKVRTLSGGIKIGYLF